MNESGLRWKGRLGRLKGLGALAILVGLALLIAGVVLVPQALGNDRSRPAEVTVAQLVRDEVPAGRYVRVTGWTNYDLWYSETEDGRTVGRYYALVDMDQPHLVLFEAEGFPLSRSDLVSVTITGMTRAIPGGLKDLLLADLAEIHANGLEISTSLYLAQGESPVSTAVALIILILGVVLLVLGVFLVAMPGTVFGPAPIEAVVAPAVGDPGVQATGRFQRFKSLQPPEIGRGTRWFENAVANLVPLPDRHLLVYIHHVITYRAYGLKVGKKESHWGLFFGQDNVVSIEPGKVYAWKDRPAVRLRYRDGQGKERDLIVSFNHTAAQSGFVEVLRRLGFSVGSGYSPDRVPTPSWSKG